MSLTPLDKAALLSGADEWTSRGDMRAGIISFRMSDGPHGVRRQLLGWGEQARRRARADRTGRTGMGGDNLGLGESLPATCFPTATAVADTWDPALAEAMGHALGEEARAQDVQVLLGPGINIKRSPLCGRNFEYYSEDPLLAGRMAAGLVRGIQGEGVAACPKHFAVNSQELRRQASNAVVDERTLREIYLTAFEIVVREARPWALMSSYNQVNGVYAHENRHLLMDILRGEWGFDGAVISDWGGSNSAVAAARAGGSMEMPSPGFTSARAIVAALRAGRLSMADIDARVAEVARLSARVRGLGVRGDARAFSGAMRGDCACVLHLDGGGAHGLGVRGDARSGARLRDAHDDGARDDSSARTGFVDAGLIGKSVRGHTVADAVDSASSHDDSSARTGFVDAGLRGNAGRNRTPSDAVGITSSSHDSSARTGITHTENPRTGTTRRGDGESGRANPSSAPSSMSAAMIDAHHALARRIAEESAVLLKNETVRPRRHATAGASSVATAPSKGTEPTETAPVNARPRPALPLAAGARIAVVGDMARVPRYQGSGSSKVNATREENLLDALRATDGITVAGYAQGYERRGGGAGADGRVDGGADGRDEGANHADGFGHITGLHRWSRHATAAAEATDDNVDCRPAAEQRAFDGKARRNRAAVVDSQRAVRAAASHGGDSRADVHGDGSHRVSVDAHARALADEAAALAARDDVNAVVVVAGLDERNEAEGLDRSTMAMPRPQNELVETLATVCRPAGKPLVVVLVAGSPVELPWIDHVDAVLYVALAGQAGASAAARLLTGRANPSGHLAETWPLRLSDTPTADWYPAVHRNAIHREGPFVGYRYYATAGVPVRFPFGHGLSYSRFVYSGLRVDDGGVTFTVTNVSDVPGATVAQLYVRAPRAGEGDSPACAPLVAAPLAASSLVALPRAAASNAAAPRAVRELKGFAKVRLGAHESREVRIPFDRYTFRHYGIGDAGVGEAGWQVTTGEWSVMIGRSADDIALATTHHVNGTVEAGADAADLRLGAYLTGRVKEATDADLCALFGVDAGVPVAGGAGASDAAGAAGSGAGADSLDGIGDDAVTGARSLDAADGTGANGELAGVGVADGAGGGAGDGAGADGPGTGSSTGGALATLPPLPGIYPDEPAVFGPNDPILDWVGSPSPVARAIARHLIKRAIRTRELHGEPDLDALFKLNMPPRVAVKLAGGMVDVRMVEGMVDIANGHSLRGLWRIGTGLLRNLTANALASRRLRRWQ